MTKPLHVKLEVSGFRAGTSAVHKSRVSELFQQEDESADDFEARAVATLKQFFSQFR